MGHDWVADSPPGDAGLEDAKEQAARGDLQPSMTSTSATGNLRLHPITPRMAHGGLGSNDKGRPESEVVHNEEKHGTLKVESVVMNMSLCKSLSARLFTIRKRL